MEEDEVGQPAEPQLEGDVTALQEVPMTPEQQQELIRQIEASQAQADPIQIKITDEKAQHFVDSQVLDQVIQQFRQEYAEAKITYFLVSRGLMSKDKQKGLHPEQVKIDVLKLGDAIETLCGIARAMADSNGTEELMEFPRPSRLEVATIEVENPTIIA